MVVQRSHIVWLSKLNAIEARIPSKLIPLPCYFIQEVRQRLCGDTPFQAGKDVSFHANDFLFGEAVVRNIHE